MTRTGVASSAKDEDDEEEDDDKEEAAAPPPNSRFSFFFSFFLDFCCRTQKLQFSQTPGWVRTAHLHTKIGFDSREKRSPSSEREPVLVTVTREKSDENNPCDLEVMRLTPFSRAFAFFWEVPSMNLNKNPMVKKIARSLKKKSCDRCIEISVFICEEKLKLR